MRPIVNGAAFRVVPCSTSNHTASALSRRSDAAWWWSRGRAPRTRCEFAFAATAYRSGGQRSPPHAGADNTRARWRVSAGCGRMHFAKSPQRTTNLNAEGLFLCERAPPTPRACAILARCECVEFRSFTEPSVSARSSPRRPQMV